MTDTLHAAFGPPGTHELPYASPPPLFAPRRAAATIVYKKRRLALAGDATSVDAAGVTDGGALPAERAPRVLRVAPAPGAPAADAAPAAAPAPQPAPLPPPRRRRRRDALRAPGAVHHVVFERPAVAPDDADEPLVDTRAVWSPMYPQLRQALDTLVATLDQVQQLQRSAALLRLLPTPTSVDR